MPTINTLGGPHRKTKFTYSGNVQTGATLHFTGEPRVYLPSSFKRSSVISMEKMTKPGGFSMPNPKPGGLGEWVAENSTQFNTVKLTPRHASFIAAILRHEGYITSGLDGNAVLLHFEED